MLFGIDNPMVNSILTIAITIPLKHFEYFSPDFSKIVVINLVIV